MNRKTKLSLKYKHTSEEKALSLQYFDHPLFEDKKAGLILPQSPQISAYRMHSGFNPSPEYLGVFITVNINSITINTSESDYSQSQVVYRVINISSSTENLVFSALHQHCVIENVPRPPGKRLEKIGNRQFFP